MNNNLIYEDFLMQLVSIDKICDYFKSDIDSVINGIAQYIKNALEKIKNVHNDLYEEFKQKITTPNYEYAGAISSDKFETFFDQNLTIKNSRNIINFLWSFIKIIVSNIIFIGISGEKEEENFEHFKQKINEGINYLQTFMTIDKQAFEKIINEGLFVIEKTFGNVETINKNQFYKYVIRLSLFDARIHADKQKSKKSSGFVIDKFYSESESVRLTLNKYFNESEIEYINEYNQLPYNKGTIDATNYNTNYGRFCLINNIYHVSGFSGSTFELFAYCMLFGFGINKTQIHALIAIFLQFNLMRGTHSDLEVICVIVKLSEHFLQLSNVIQNVVHADHIVFNKGKLQENLLLEFKSEEDKIKFKYIL